MSTGKSRQEDANMMYGLGHRVQRGRAQIMSVTRAPREGVPSEIIVTITIRVAK